MLKLFNIDHLKELRMFRALRPLHQIQKIKSVRVMIEVILSSFFMIKDSLFIILAYFCIFAVVGQVIWGGELKYSCIDLTTGIPNINFSDDDGTYKMCARDSDCVDIATGLTCAKLILNPHYGFLNMDTFLYALLIAF
jgi:hypothetical protein